MTTTEWNEMAAVLTETMGPEAQTPESASLVIHAATLLAVGHPVTLEQVGAALGWPPDRVMDVLRFLQENREVEVDQDGHIVGVAGLSLNPTQHQFHLAGRMLYTWCAVDALFFPPLLGQTAQVVSTCPVTGTEIRLTVSPERVTQVDPPGTVLSIVIPDASSEAAANCDPQQCGPQQSPLLGPDGAFCGNVHFFSSEEAAAVWLAAHSDAVVLPVHDAFKLATEVWARPLLGQAQQ